MTQISKNKIFKFFSYRDPRCSETFDEFAKSREWSLKNITAAQLDEGVLGEAENGKTINIDVSIPKGSKKEKEVVTRPNE